MFRSVLYFALIDMRLMCRSFSVSYNTSLLFYTEYAAGDSAAETLKAIAHGHRDPGVGFELITEPAYIRSQGSCR